MVMVPLYAIASLISLFSLEAAFFIDAIRDIYEVRLTLSPRSLGIADCAMSSGATISAGGEKIFQISMSAADLYESILDRGLLGTIVRIQC